MARAVGINHVALEVGSIDEALAFYGSLFELRLRGGNSFHDPWGNHVQVVAYEDVQFTKAPEILRGMDLELGKSESALAELREKGLA